MYLVLSLHGEGRRENGKGSSRCEADVIAIAAESAPACGMCNELGMVRL